MHENSAPFSDDYVSKNQTKENEKKDKLEEIIKSSDEDKDQVMYSISKPKRVIIRAIIIHDKS